MRKIQVLILRLVLDSSLPAELVGSLQAVPDGKPHSFRGEKAFLAVLHQLDRPDEDAGESAQEAVSEGAQSHANPITPENSE